MGHPAYSKDEINWMLFYKLLGLTLQQIQCLHNARFEDVPRTMDAIQTKLKEVKYGNSLQAEDGDRICLSRVDQYLTARIGEFDITLRQHFRLKRLPDRDRYLLDNYVCSRHFQGDSILIFRQIDQFLKNRQVHRTYRG